MAVLAYELPETYASVTRPVVLEVMKQLLDNLKINRDEVTIAFPGANGKLTTWNANNVQEVDSANFNSRERIFINVKEDYIEDDLLTLVSKRKEYPPIFEDKDAKIRISPIYSRTKVNISITYRSKDRWQAESFRDNWRRKIAENREYMAFYAHYIYPIPEVVEQVLFLLYKTRHVHKPDFERYQDYLFHFGSEKLTSLTNAAGKGDTLGLAECQERIFGNFNDAAPPEVEKDDLGSVWTTSFDFEFHYDKPISIEVNYPILIYNQMVHPVLYPEVMFDVDRVMKQGAWHQVNYANIINESGYQWHARGAVIRIPKFDDWSSFKQWRNHRPLLSALLCVEEEDPTYICNLQDMGDYKLHEVLVPHFIHNRHRLTVANEFPFYINLYRGDTLLTEDQLIIDEHLNIRSRQPLSFFENQHFVIHVIKDLNYLSKEAQDYFFKNPALVNAWLDLMLGHVPINGYPKPNASGYISKADFEKVARINNLGDKQNDKLVSPGCIFATLGIFSVVSHSNNEKDQIRHGNRASNKADRYTQRGISTT